jgi:flagellar capping protein FliD
MFTFARGIASQVDQFYLYANDFVDGSFKKTNESYDNTIDRMGDRIISMQDRVDRFRQSLIKQFASLEQSIQRLNSQSSAFQSQIGSLR